MFNIGQRIRENVLKKIIQALGIFVPISNIVLILYFLFFKNIFIFFAFIVNITSYLGVLVIYYFTFRKKLLRIKYSVIFLMIIGLIIITLFTYFAGGFSGPIIPIFFFIIVLFAVFLDPKEATLFSFIVIIIYLTFFFGEIYNIIVPLETNEIVLNISRVLVDVVVFYGLTQLVTIISKNAEDSINFYKLRSVRLSKIRKRLEFLVRKRTNQLEQSNKKLRKAETELSKNYKELKKLDVEKDEFISIATHELKTPLTAIGGYAQLLKDEKIAKNSGKRRQFLDVLDNESKRLSGLVTDILNLSRIDLGVMRYDIESVDIYELMKAVESEFGTKISQSGLEKEFALEKNLPKIDTDKYKLHEIMDNLISNAIKYTPKGKITIRVVKRGGFIQFSIEDTGIGIKRKDYIKIFKRFSQIDSSITRKYRGSGLGLSICKEYVDKLGGNIWFKSRLGKGSTFYFKLPIKSKVEEKVA